MWKEQVMEPERDTTATVDDQELESRESEELVEEDLVVEEVSIDGMCGVY
jgi:mycofactocin precursor